MDDTDLLGRLAVALAIGLLVGLERGWRTRDEADHQRAAGLRTFALSGLLGGIAGALAQLLGPFILGAAFLGYALVFAAFHWLEARAENNLSATSVVAGLVTFLLGAYAVLGILHIAIAAAVATVVLLALREQLHRLVGRLTWLEIRAILTLLAMTFLLLPLLPDRTIDPWGAVNPSEIWVLAILIAGISFGGYVAIRSLGERLGVMAAAVAGGLASSTATTLTLARLGRNRPGAARLLSAGIVASGAVMVARVSFLLGVLDAALLTTLWPFLAATGLAFALGALLLALDRTATTHPDLALANPLEIGTALKLAAFILVVLIATAVLREQLGDVGLLAVAAISGIADVDAVTISMARLPAAEDGSRIAAWGVGVALAVNSVSKSAMAGWFGGARIGLPVLAVSLAALALGAAAQLA